MRRNQMARRAALLAASSTRQRRRRAARAAEPGAAASASAGDKHWPLGCGRGLAGKQRAAQGLRGQTKPRKAAIIALHAVLVGSPDSSA